MSTGLTRQIKSKAGQSGRSPSLHAVPREDTAAMESLMAGDVDVNAVTSTGMTPLLCAAAKGHLGTVRALLNRGAAVNQKRNDGFTALALAAFYGHEHVVRELLNHGADVKAHDRSRTSAERWAELRNFRRISVLLREIRERSVEMAASETIPVSEPNLFQQPSPEPSPKNSPEPSAPEKDIEVRSERTPVSQRIETVAAKPVNEDLDDEAFPEGSIRRVGGSTTTTAPMMALEDRVENTVAFSPFSALVDRLAASWKQVATVMLGVVLLSAVATLAAWKTVVRKAKPTSKPAITETSNLPAESEPPASLPSQPATPPPDAKTQTSPEVSPAEEGADAIQRQSSDDDTTTRASHSSPTVDLTSGRVAGPEPKRRSEKPRSQPSNQPVSEVGRAPHTNRHRSESGSSDSNGARNGSTEESGPAAIKIVSEPSTKQVRKTSPVKEIQAQSTAPLEGSSPKRKVIQWP